MLTDAQRPTTLAVVSLDSRGERSFSFYRQHSADLALSPDDVPDEALRSTHFFHFGGVSLTANPARDTVLDAARRARNLGACVTYDPNYRPALWGSRAEAVTQLARPLPLVDILKVSDEEMALLTGTDNLRDGSAALADAGIPLVLVTLGAKGVFYRFRGETGIVDGVPCVVADTNGAGDTFFGAFLSRMRAFTLDSLTIPQLRDMLGYANRAASWTTSRSGAIPAMPTAEEMR
jgi:sugar kinases, ribokinase family